MISSKPGTECIVSGQGKWRLTYNEDGEVIALELWAADKHLADKTYSYEVIDIKPR